MQDPEKSQSSLFITNGKAAVLTLDAAYGLKSADF